MEIINMHIALALFATTLLTLIGVIAVVELIDSVAYNKMSTDGHIVFACMFLIVLLVVAVTIAKIWSTLL